MPDTAPGSSAPAAVDSALGAAAKRAADDPGLTPGLAVPGPAAPGQPAPAASTADDRATEFVPAEGTADTTSAGTLLVAAYAVMWTLLVVFLWAGWRRQSALEARLERLEKPGGPPPS